MYIAFGTVPRESLMPIPTPEQNYGERSDDTGHHKGMRRVEYASRRPFCNHVRLVKDQTVSASLQSGKNRGFKAFVVVISAVLGLFLTACGEAEFSSTFERDESGEHSLAFTVPRPEFESAMERQEADATLDLISNQAAEGGLRVERVLTQDHVTIRITTTDQTETETGAALNSLLNASGINANPGISAPFRGNFQRASGPVGGNRFVLDMTVDGPDLYNSIDVLALRIRHEAPPEEVRENITITYVATFPGDVTETDGELIDDNVVRWAISADQQTSVYAESRLAGSGSAALFIAAGLVSLVAVMVLAVIVAILLNRRGRLATRLSAATAEFPRHIAITEEGVWVAHRIRRYVDRLHHRSNRERSESGRIDPEEAQEERT